MSALCDALKRENKVLLRNTTRDIATKLQFFESQGMSTF